MTSGSSSRQTRELPGFNPHAVAIAKRQYFQPGEDTVGELFRRVADWVAQAEAPAVRAETADAFYSLMAEQRFCPGGRVLAGAATAHGNVLNCFVQDGRPEQAGSDAWVMNLAGKLAAVTKVGGGNGVNLDPIGPKRPFTGRVGTLYLTVEPTHPDHAKISTGTFLDLVRGETVTRGYRRARFVEHADIPAGAVLRRVADSVDDIWQAASDMVTVLLSGEDVVIDLSDLRPEGSEVRGSGGTSSGPASFGVEVFDNFAIWAGLGGAAYAGPVATLRYVFANTLRAIRQGGTRRGAGMATLSITHPDVHDFITAKDLSRERAEGDISTFNISVLVTDDFMRTAAQHRSGVLWDIANHAWGTGEPGLIYVDRINEHNPMRAALGDIVATNPCGEVVLYPGEPCDLGAINLAAYVTAPGTGLAGFDMQAFAADTRTCVRFLDDVLDVNVFALDDNREMSRSLRRLGLGVMGLADALIRMGYSYASQEGRDAVAVMIDTLREVATQASQELGHERGPFPLASSADIKAPRRNVAVLTVAPTGTTSMLFGVSSGVEPVFAPYVHRKIGTEYHAIVHPLFQELMERHQPAPGYAVDGAWDWDKVLAAVQANHGSVQGLAFVPDDVRSVMVCAHDITASDHVRMQGAVQRAFDGGDGVANSISKTINLANGASIADVFDAYSLAFTEGCKGITVYRDGSRDFQVLSTSSSASDTAGQPSFGSHGPTSGTEPTPTQVEPVPAFEVAASTPAYAAVASATAATYDAVTATASPEVPASATVSAQPVPAPVASAPAAVVATPPAASAPGSGATNAGPHYERLPGEPLFDRPLRLQGQTDQVKLMLPNGDKRGFYVTVNSQDGLPVEVFIASGKAGDEANADSEALGRVVSIALQYGVPAEALVKTLRGINGGMYGTYHGRMVASKADLLAVALETAGVENVLNRNVGCPDCGGKLRFEEGCQKCDRCGYSKCG